MPERLRLPVNVSAPYFRAVLRDGNTLVDGVHPYHAGHTIERTAGLRPDGIFAEWSWNGRRLTVVNDRQGFYPFYYYVKPGEIGISPSILKLIEIGASTEPDDAGMAVFLRLGFFIGDDTPFKNIRAVPRCTAFYWQDGELKISRDLKVVKMDPIDRKNAIDGYIELFRQSILRRAPNAANFAVPLSGGRDSRHILLELCHSNNPPPIIVTAETFPFTGSEDVPVARKLTEALKLSHVVVSQSRNRLDAEIRKNLATNLCSDEHVWYLPVADYLRGRASVVYDGIGGDVLTAGLFLNRSRLERFEASEYTELAEDLLREEPTFEKMLSNILPPLEYRRFSFELAVQHLSEELRLYSGFANPVGAFFLANRTRREIALSPYCLLEGVETVFSPYLDHDLYDFLTSLPASMLLDHELHTETIRQAYPLYSEIPFGRKVKGSIESPSYFRRFALDLSVYAYRHLPLRYVRSGFLFPRLLRGIADARYGESLNWFGYLVVYLIQIQDFFT